ncbi:YceI family protein [Algivirga pacifica]|uniref:Lipid/polyisoprenoid-binding YceI-like domain-containing protein n=1 Tax=Algivirga pacifica TaxID=1162670 RepID=A0ABP9D5X2_9BACT
MRMKTLVTALLIFLASLAGAQQRMLVSKGSVHFTSNAPLEVIDASSNALKGILEMPTRKFAFTAAIKSFKGFNSSLQQQHFNENYLESDRYPKAVFKGKIIEKIDFTQDGTYKVRAKGKLSIHGLEQIRIFKVNLKIIEGVVHFDAKFKVPLSDHDISIPQIVHQKIATEIDVAIQGLFEAPQQ